MMVVADDLRLSILQYAIEGKLSKQLEEDTPVEATLEKLSSIKKHLIQTSAIKKEKPYTGDGTLPFDIPATWRWVRLFDIGELSRGKSKHRPRNDDVLYINGTIPLIQTGDVAAAKKYIKSYGKCYNEIGLAQSRLWKAGTLCITIAANIGDVAILGFDACFPDSVVGFQPFTEDVNIEYIYYMLLAYKRRMNAKATKVAQSNLSLDKMSTMLFPFPPVEEQRRLVGRLNDIMKKVDEYEKIEKQLTELKAALPSSMREAILFAAVQGKLTKQLETDSSVEEYLNAVRTEKAASIFEGLPKRGKSSEAKEYPFDIPNTWEWVRLGDIANLKIGKTPPRGEAKWWHPDYPWVSIADIPDGKTLLQTAESVSSSAFDNFFKSTIIPKGTLLMSFKLTIGKVCVLGIDALHNEAIVSIRPYMDKNMQIRNYLLRILPFISQYGESKNAIKGNTLNATSLSNLPIPFPPVEEQQRIVERLDKLLPLCDELI